MNLHNEWFELVSSTQKNAYAVKGLYLKTEFLVKCPRQGQISYEEEKIS